MTQADKAAADAWARDDIYEMVEAMDLPHRAHWVMIEELSGLEPGDFA